MKQEILAAEQHAQWLNGQVKEYHDTQRLELARRVYAHHADAFCEDAVKVLVLIENLENPVSREALVSLVKNSNKAAVVLCEHATGLELPRTNKDKEAFLKQLQKEQYLSPKPFDAKTWYINVNGEGFRKVRANHYATIEGREFFMVRDDRSNDGNRYSISDARTGTRAVKAMSKIKAEEYFQAYVKGWSAARLSRYLQALEAKIGLSPLFEPCQHAEDSIDRVAM